ncbi:MAG: hypothetical protein ACREBW_00020 [Candidatus Micrarchaeaceae archaeon]
MKVIDPTSGSRAIELKPTETLTSVRLASALKQFGGYSRAESKELAAQVFDAIEMQLHSAKYAVRA